MLGESRVQLFKSKYFEEVQKQRDSDVTTEGMKKHGRKVIPREELDGIVPRYA